MSDKEIAKRIVKYYRGKGSFLPPNKRTIKYLLEQNIKLIDAFSWNDTKEGFDFWSHLYHSKFRESNSLRKFLQKNLFINENFIYLKAFV